MTRPLTLLTIHAHPDDETISTGGVMARYLAEGERVVCLTSNLGEHGEIVVPDMDTPENHARLADIRGQELAEARHVTVPVAYGGLDTDEVAEATGLTADEIVRCHAEPEYQVSAAASVGQPMMTGVDERLQVPRRKTPRTDVPALAVAIAKAYVESTSPAPVTHGS